MSSKKIPHTFAISVPVSRRDFLRTSALATSAMAICGSATAAIPEHRKLTANDKLNIACIGSGGKGRSDMQEMFNCGDNIVALCDINAEQAEGAAKIVRARNPDVKIFKDYREMLDKMGNQIDACTVSTPDHMHAPASIAAMSLGKHVYCQKPLTWCIDESRTMKKLAKEAGIISQMGNQGSAGEGLRRGVEIVQAGIIGDVKEIQAWTNRPVWPQGFARPEGEDPVPANLDWNLWLGVAPLRPFKKDIYTPFKWRGWKDFGCGALGDMACHLLNFPFRALKMGYPSSVQADNGDNFDETFPKNGKVTFQFPEREGLPPLKMVWYEGGWKPKNEEVQAVADMQGGTLPNNGVVLIGSKGVIFQADDYGANLYIKLNGDAKLTSVTKHEAAKAVPVTIARSGNNYKEWIDACKGGPATYSNFDIAAFLTESILVGCVAQRFDKQLIEWDGPNAVSKNFAAANAFVRREYRKF